MDEEVSGREDPPGPNWFSIADFYNRNALESRHTPEQ